ncbi:hypothetical protein HK102_012595 [Quaeritorhiza haematococci]|nr:hypothetical protein HK102_012595 [Quaeritorhiza haematococci]
MKSLLATILVALALAASAQAAPVDSQDVAVAVNTGATLDNGAVVEKRQKYCLDPWGRKYPC